MAHPVDVLHTYVSLRARPCLYPDARLPAARRPYVLQGQWLLPLRVSAAAVDDGVVDTPAWPQSLRAWLQATAAAPMEARVPVLAVGSNAYPRQLVDKFALRRPRDATVVVEPCRLADAAVVFCPRLSQPGYVPVTLMPRPGVALQTWLQWLTADQLEIISATEGPRYALVECGETTVVAADGDRVVPRVFGWLADQSLQLDGAPLSAAPAEAEQRLLARLWRACGPDGLAWGACRLPPDQDLHACVQDFLARRALPIRLPSDWPASKWHTVERDAPGFSARLFPR